MHLVRGVRRESRVAVLGETMGELFGRRKKYMNTFHEIILLD